MLVVWWRPLALTPCNRPFSLSALYPPHCPHEVLPSLTTWVFHLDNETIGASNNSMTKSKPTKYLQISAPSFQLIKELYIKQHRVAWADWLIFIRVPIHFWKKNTSSLMTTMKTKKERKNNQLYVTSVWNPFRFESNTRKYSIQLHW